MGLHSIHVDCSVFVIIFFFLDVAFLHNNANYCKETFWSPLLLPCLYLLFSFHIIQDILSDVKKRVDLLNKKLFDAEFSKGKTKAVLDAAAKALSLIDHDSSTGIRASKALKQYGIDKLVNVTSLCFNSPLETLTDSCVNVKVNFSTSVGTGMNSYDFNTCLNKDVVSNLGQFVANSLFPDVTSERHRRSLLSEESDPGARYEMPEDDEVGRFRILIKLFLDN